MFNEETVERREQLRDFELLAEISREGRACPTPVALVAELRLSPLLVDIDRTAPRNTGWVNFVLGGSDGSSGEGGYGGELAVPSPGGTLVLEFYRGRYDGMWGDDWSVGTTIGIIDNPHGAIRTTVLCFEALAAATSWASWLITPAYAPHLGFEPAAAYRVPHAPLTVGAFTPPR